MIQEKPIKKRMSVKQLRKDIEYSPPHERISCSNCINFIQDITVKSRNDWYKCYKYNITVNSFAICKSFKSHF
jgi:hypothetical protein